MFSRTTSLKRPRSGRRLLGIFALTILLPGSLLAGLGVRALIQERRTAEVEIEKRLNRARVGADGGPPEFTGLDMNLGTTGVFSMTAEGRGSHSTRRFPDPTSSCRSTCHR